MFSETLNFLKLIRVLPRRMLLETPGVEADVPMLRGVWGAALHDLDRPVYRRVFDPSSEGHLVDGRQVPGYLLRPAPADPNFAPAVEWTLMADAIDDDAILCRAWDIASGMGLGPQRRRFHLRQTLVLGPDGRPESGQEAWPLSEAVWPPGDPHKPCRLVFPAPLRLRRHGRLIESPALPDLIVAACRRIRLFLPAERQGAWDELRREALERSRHVASAAWQGERLDLHRYSACQQAELDLQGVSGRLELPEGPGDLWPLLAAAEWLHLGKSTVMGLGQLCVE